MLELVELQKQGNIKANRKKDVLSVAIGSNEHGGRFRGVPSKLSIKDGFEKDQARYWSHDRYKKEMYEAIDKALNEKFKDFFMATTVE